LTRHQSFKGLIAFGLMILNGGTAALRFVTARARNELTSRFKALIDVAIFIRGRRRAIAAQEDRARAGT
jgi:uncharacterized RDD family membrane protein YckC